MDIRSTFVDSLFYFLNAIGKKFQIQLYDRFNIHFAIIGNIRMLTHFYTAKMFTQNPVNNMSTEYGISYYENAENMWNSVFAVSSVYFDVFYINAETNTLS